MEQKLVNHFMAEKAGMSAVDKTEVNKKVEAMTKGTHKHAFQKQLDEKRSAEIARMIKKIEEYEENSEKKHIQEQVRLKIECIEATRDLTRYWAHFDFDMFYVACQLLSRPELADKPCAVGSHDGVLCTSNYEARKFGVRSAIPTFIAKKLCPQLILFQPNFEKYKKFSDIFRTILSEFDENLQSLGLDEAYIDLTEHVGGKQHSEIGDFVKKIRQRIFNETGLTVSCGVGANKMLCKMASEERKPNDQYVLQNNRQAILKYLADKPIRKIPGIGPVNELFLRGIRINTGAELLKHMDHISICFSQNTTEGFIFSGLGISRNTHEFKERKSVGRSDTFRATDDQKKWFELLHSLTDQVVGDLNELRVLAKTITVSYQSHTFQKHDKSHTIDKYTNKKKDLWDVVEKVIKEIKYGTKLRLLGVRCTNLMSEEDFKKNTLEAYFKKPSTLSISEQADRHTDKPTNKATEKTTDLQLSDQEQPPKSDTNSVISNRNSEVQKNFECPVCNKVIECRGNYSKFDRHINKCLQEQINPIEMPQDEVRHVQESLPDRRKKAEIVQKPKSERPRSKNEKAAKQPKSVQSSLNNFLKKP